MNSKNDSRTFEDELFPDQDDGVHDEISSDEAPPQLPLRGRPVFITNVLKWEASVDLFGRCRRDTSICSEFKVLVANLEYIGTSKE